MTCRCDEPVDREVVIGGVSFHERRVNGELIFRYPCVFEVETDPQREMIERMTVYPKESR